jgi:DNA recombination protein RmuC|tara:strand:- start:1135 stop:2211 length:1077 start_codon:yes stop_codon:yes gene_type:complete
MELLVPSLVTFALGLLIGWLLAQKSDSDKKSIVKDVARDALKDNREGFIEAAKIVLKPLDDALKALDKKTGELEIKRATAYVELSEQIKGMVSSAKEMQASSVNMQNLLTYSSQARGNWGEYLLQNIVEFAGMKEHVHFEVQEPLSDGSRPDMVILLPGGAGIPVDSKCPFKKYAEAKEETEPRRVKELMKAHGDAVKGHVTELIRRDYSKYTHGDSDFTVMFMPGDHLLGAALDEHPGLQDEALTHQILITGPSTLVALLRTVRIYWTHEETNRNAQEIATAARTLYDRVEIWMEHYGEIGESLTKAVKAFNKSKRSYLHRIVPAGKKVMDLKVTQPKNKPLDDAKSGPKTIDILPE